MQLVIYINRLPIDRKYKFKYIWIVNAEKQNVILAGNGIHSYSAHTGDYKLLL